jgi:hypothetical protein
LLDQLGYFIQRIIAPNATCTCLTRFILHRSPSLQSSH